MSVQSELVLQTEPCLSCSAEGERLAVQIRTLKNTEARADQYCLSCACALITGIDKLLREAPKS